MTEIEKKVRKKLFEMQDTTYRDFQSKLMPNVDYAKIIGVRTPLLRKYAAELAASGDADAFLASLPHEYYEENNLHGFLIEKIKDYDRAVREVDAFLPYVDNWATCDLMSPKIFGKHLPGLYEKIKEWIASGRTYTVRFGIEMLMSFYLGESFTYEAPALVASIVSDEYYVKMMIAWYFATALAKQYDAVIPYITDYRLDGWIHNKTIQKAVESYRITPEQKDYLRSYRIKASKN